MIPPVTVGSTARLVELVKPKRIGVDGNFKRKLMEHLCKDNKTLSFPTRSPRNVANVGGEKSYMLLGSLAKLERALMKWTLDELILKHKFTPVTPPNVIYDHIIDRCGFPTSSDRSQVYKISASSEESILQDSKTEEDRENESCLAGTSEFALASIHIGDTIPIEDLPKKYCALSRCYRAETSNISSEWGLYRVHYFNKVEMVGLTMPDKSSEMHEEFLQIQKDLFSRLNLHFRVLDMPKDDLGLSAKKKYDVEAWMEGRQRYGEISSTSNCDNYQAQRLNIKYSRMVEREDQLDLESDFVHTINGTACSSIRTLIALIEQHQDEDGRVALPECLVPYMNNISFIPTDDDQRLLKDVDLYPYSSENE